MNTKYLTSLVLLVVACSGGQTTGGGEEAGQSEVQLKKAAADASASHTAQGDACKEHGWYGDGECDQFCPTVDSVDCTPSSGSGGGVMCAAFVEEANGVCSRKLNDPCISQDPDCKDIVCTAIAREANGVCESDANDPCIAYQDPDCAVGDPMPTDPPGDDPIACPAIAQEADGVCPKYDAKDVCQFYSDPDCTKAPVACATYIELSDGECKRAPSDPCIFQDPDCIAK